LIKSAAELVIGPTFFDFSLVTERTGSHRPENKAIVLGEGANFGIDLGIKPVGLLYGRFEVVQDKPPRYSTEVTKGVFDAPKKVVGCLAIDGLAIGLARVRQHDAEDVSSAALAVGRDDWSTGTEVDLCLVSRLTFKMPEGKLVYGLQAADKATDGIVAALEAVFGSEILVDALGA
jgi:hypothetical protein